MNSLDSNSCGVKWGWEQQIYLVDKCSIEPRNKWEFNLHSITKKSLKDIFLQIFNSNFNTILQ